MSYTVSITRQGLVFDLVTPSNPDTKGPPVAIFVGTEDLADKIDKMAEARCARRRGNGKNPRAATRDRHFEANLDGISLKAPAMPVDWTQRLIELALVAALTFLGALYFV